MSAKTKKPTKRNDTGRDKIDNPLRYMSPERIERMAKRFERSTILFFASTLIFIILLAGAILSRQEVIFDIGVAIIFLAWFPSLIVAAFTAKYYDPYGLSDMVASSKKSEDKSLWLV